MDFNLLMPKHPDNTTLPDSFRKERIMKLQYMADASQYGDAMLPDFSDSQLFGDDVDDFMLFSKDLSFDSSMLAPQCEMPDFTRPVVPSSQDPFEDAYCVSATMVELHSDPMANASNLFYHTPQIQDYALQSPASTASTRSPIETAQNVNLEEADDQVCKPRKRGRKPRVKTEEEKEHQLHKQRQRNRLAAGRCRNKKKEETHDLVSSAERLRERRDSLQTALDSLSSEVLNLKEAVMQHRFCGAGEVDIYLQRQFKSLVSSSDEASQSPSATAGKHTSAKSQTTSPPLFDDGLSPSPLCSPVFSDKDS